MVILKPLPGSIDVAIVQVRGVWQIIHSGRRWGQFDFRVDAEEAAIRMAGHLVAAGAVRIYVQGIGGELVPITGLAAVELSSSAAGPEPRAASSAGR